MIYAQGLERQIICFQLPILPILIYTILGIRSLFVKQGLFLLLRSVMKINEIKTFKALSKVKRDSDIIMILLFPSIYHGAWHMGAQFYC